MVLKFQSFIHNTAQLIITIEKASTQLLCKELWTFLTFLWMRILASQKRFIMLVYFQVWQCSNVGTRVHCFLIERKHLRSTDNSNNLLKKLTAV